MKKPHLLRLGLHQFSLRFAFLCLTVVALCLGVVAYRVERQRGAVAAILEAGGRVTYNHKVIVGFREYPNPDLTPNADVYPNWLRDRLGDDWLYPVRNVTLYGDGCNDETLNIVESLPQVKKLALWPWVKTPEEMRGGEVHQGPLAGVTDDGLKVLRSLRRLEHVSFMGNRVTDKGLEHLKFHPSLTSVQIDPGPASAITQEGYASLMETLSTSQPQP